MADGKSEAELQQIARNLCAQSGVDYDAALSQFRAIMGINR